MAGSRGRARPAAPPEEAPFWRTTPLAEMTPAQWESLCDGCGRCCLIKLEYEDTGEIDWTNIACRQLDPDTCKCRNYALRRTLVEDCLSLTPAMIDRLAWLPATCGYRLVAEGRDLQWWHPLVSGSAETVHQAGISVRRKVIGEDEAGPPEDHVVDWLE